LVSADYHLLSLSALLPNLPKPLIFTSKKNAIPFAPIKSIKHQIFAFVSSDQNPTILYLA